MGAGAHRRQQPVRTGDGGVPDACRGGAGALPVLHSGGPGGVPHLCRPSDLPSVQPVPRIDGVVHGRHGVPHASGEGRMPHLVLGRVVRFGGDEPGLRVGCSGGDVLDRRIGHRLRQQRLSRHVHSLCRDHVRDLPGGGHGGRVFPRSMQGPSFFVPSGRRIGSGSSSREGYSMRCVTCTTRSPGTSPTRYS